MSKLLVRANKHAGPSEPLVHVTPEQAGWTYTGFSVYRLPARESLHLKPEDKETVVIVLEGTCDVSVDQIVFTHVGNRESVFASGPPEAVYCPPKSAITVKSLTRCEVAVATAACREGVGEPRRISREEIPYEERGEGFTRRYIHHILDEHHPAKKLLLVEVVTPAGHWSSFPPHKHDTEIPGRETYLEETYYYRIDPAHGWAVQRVYDKHGLDETLTPGDGDLVLVPRGYHPAASPPGFTTYYLNVMAGHQRVWKYTLDHDFEHIAPKDGNIMGKIQATAGESPQN